MWRWLAKLFTRQAVEWYKAAPAIRPGLPSPLDPPPVGLAAKVRVPLVADWHELCRRDYVLDRMDCSNLSAEYCRRLRAERYVADVWYCIATNGGEHAIVAVWDAEFHCWLYCDATVLAWAWDARRFGQLLYRFSDSWLYDGNNPEARYG